MNQDNQHTLWDQGEHPSMALLQQYQEGKLSPNLHHQLERHLLDCVLCSDILEGQALFDSPKIDAAERELNERIATTFQHKKRKTLPVYLSDRRVAAALALVLCSMVLLFYYNFKGLNQKQPGIVSVSERTVKESNDLKEVTASSVTDKPAEAVNDTTRPAIAANSAPRTCLKKSITPRPSLAPQEDKPDIKTIEEPAEEVIISADKLAVAPVTESSKPLAFQDIQKFATDTLSISKALQGRVAGVSTHAARSVAMKNVQGQVLSPDGQPLPGVAVTLKGTTTGVATDENGNFSMSLPVDKATIVFGFIGYERLEKAIDGNTNYLTVNLQEDTKSLSEVVVTGYSSSSVKAPPVLVAARPVLSSKAYKKYLEKEIRYTSTSIRGRVVVQAIISTSGELHNLQVIKSLCSSCDEEALRLIRQGPTWKPAEQDGMKVEQKVKIVIRFRPDHKK